MAELLSLHNVCASYGPIEVLKNVSLTVNTGEIVTLIGSNGAGKTSTLRCASRIHQIKSGTLTFQGEDIGATPAHELIPRGMAHVPEGRRIFSRLTVLENLELGGYTSSDPSVRIRNMEKVFSLFPVLKERRSQPGGTLSGGEQQMLAIGRALMSSPMLLLLDEPSMGVAPIFVSKIIDTIKTLNHEGVTILIVEQNAHLALSIAHRGYVLETGRIILEDEGQKLLKNPEVQDAYLGE